MAEYREHDSKVGADFKLPELTDQQLVVCLLSSFGESNKRIARALDKSLRSVELDRQVVARSLGIPTRLLFVWAVENRAELQAETARRLEIPELVWQYIGKITQSAARSPVDAAQPGRPTLVGDPTSRPGIACS